MKKLLYAVAATVMLSMPALAENIDQANGTSAAGAQVSYKWEYWNEKNTQGEYYPNWLITYDPALTAAPTVKLDYTLKKGETTVSSGAATFTTTADAQAQRSNFYVPAGKLEEGNYTIDWTFSVTPEGATEAQTQNVSTPFSVAAAPVQAYNFTFQHEEEVTPQTIVVKYKFVEKDGKEVPAGAKYNVSLGIQPGGYDEKGDAAEGTITFKELKPNTTYTIYTNNPSVTIDDVAYTAVVDGTFTAKTEDGVVEEPYSFKHTEVVTGSTITMNYEFVANDDKVIPADAKYNVHLGLTPGGFDIYRTEGPKGSITFTGLTPSTEYTIWTNGPTMTVGQEVFKPVVDGNFNVKTTDAEDPAAYDLTLNYKEATATENSITVNYEVVAGENQTLPADAAYNIAFALNNVGSGIMAVGTEGPTGSVTFTGLEADKEYTVVPNWPQVKIGEMVYTVKAENTTVKTEAAKPLYSFKFTHTEEVTDKTIAVSYKFVEAEGKEVPAGAVYTVKLGCTPGNTDVEGDNAAEGTITFTNREPSTEYTIYTNGPKVTIDGIDYMAETEETFLVTTDKAVIIPAITVTASNATATGETTGTIDYVITTDQAALEGVTYTVWCVNADNAETELGRKENATLTGTLDLTNLNSKAETSLRVYAKAVTAEGNESNVAEFPAAGSTDKFMINTDLSGIESVGGEFDATAEYFNLQGVRVANPANGLYIKVKDGKAIKAILK